MSQCSRWTSFLRLPQQTAPSEIESISAPQDCSLKLRCPQDRLLLKVVESDFSHFSISSDHGYQLSSVSLLSLEALPLFDDPFLSLTIYLCVFVNSLSPLTMKQVTAFGPPLTQYASLILMMRLVRFHSKVTLSFCGNYSLGLCPDL